MPWSTVESGSNRVARPTGERSGLGFVEPTPLERSAPTPCSPMSSSRTNRSFGRRPRNQWSSVAFPPAPNRLQTLVDRWLAAVRAGSSATEPGKSCITLLVEPVADSTKGPVTAVIPDGPLHSIAFGALWTGEAISRRAHGVVDCHQLRKLSCDGWTRRCRRRGPARALVVGNPFLRAGRRPHSPHCVMRRPRLARSRTPIRCRGCSSGVRRPKLQCCRGCHQPTWSTSPPTPSSIRPDRSSRGFLSPAPAGRRLVSAISASSEAGLRGSIVLASCRSAAGRPSPRVWGDQPRARPGAGRRARSHRSIVGHRRCTGARSGSRASPATCRRHPVASALRESQLSLLRRGDEYSAPRLWAALVGIGESTATVVDRSGQYTN